MVVNNPNNWHWVDKNCIDWSKKYFKENLVGVSATTKDQQVEITEVKSIEGDVEVCQRKGKVISLFDLKLVLSFKGHVTDADEKIETNGSVVIPELAYDTEEDELQFNLSIANDNSKTENIKSIFRKELEPKLRKKLVQFGKDLITTHGNDIQLPEDQVKSAYTLSNQKSSSPSPAVGSQTDSSKSSTAKASSSAKAASGSSSESSIPKYNTSSLHIETSFITTADQIFETFLDHARVAAWTRAPPILNPTEGGTYELFNGNIEGKFLKLEKNKRLNMLWRLRDWKVGHFANLDIKLNELDSETKAEILFTGIPIGEEEKVENNFNEYYIKSIKITFGFGIVL